MKAFYFSGLKINTSDLNGWIQDRSASRFQDWWTTSEGVFNRPQINRYQCYEIDDIYDFIAIEAVMAYEWGRGTEPL